jgi:HPt (histidine-containing phosphotransfer) domain-containing protein
MPETIDPHLRDVWAEFERMIFQRLQAIQAAAQAAERGSLDEALRQTAILEAHRLAGSLGTFGLAEGTRLAREIESLLERDTEDGAAEASRLTPLVAALAVILEANRVRRD